jgi:hypothetical protein
MADSTIDSELIYLLPCRFGPATIFDEKDLPGGITGALHHNVATPYFEPGTVAQLYCNGSYGKEGFSEFVYLQFESTSGPGSIAAKQVAVPDSATAWYTFTQDPDDCTVATGNALAVVSLAELTDAYYGWHWSGGVCPEQYVSGMAGNYNTAAGGLIAGNIVAHDDEDEEIGFGPCGGDTEVIIGFALAADAA